MTPPHDLIPFREGWARRQPLRSWLRNVFRVTGTGCITCGTPVRLLRGTTTWDQHICNTCARVTPPATY